MCTALSSLVTRVQAALTSRGALERDRIAACPPMPLVKGSGKEPTTAGMVSVALQSCRSHQMWSPACTAVVAAPLEACTPLT